MASHIHAHGHTGTGRAAVRVRGPILDHPVANGVEIIAHTDMNGRPDGLQMQYQEVDGKHYLYVGHFWSGGVSILDVTDPATPEVVGFVATPNPDTWHIKVQVADGIMMLPSELNFFASGVDAKNVRSGVRFLDVKDPANPVELSFAEAGGIGCHRSWWNGGDYAYVSAGITAPGISMHGIPDTTRIMLTLDVSDPRNPRRVSEFWLPIQRGEGQPMGDGETLYTHQPLIEDDRAYVAYWDGGFAIVDIEDRARPRLVSHVKTFPEMSDGNTHTCMPIRERDELVVIEENTANFGGEGLKSIWVFDISDEEHPEPISKMPVPRPSSEEPYETYVERGDRFGPHCIHENHVNTKREIDKIYATYCNAGLRIYDISDSANPREVASFVTPDPDTILDPRPYDREFDIFHGGSRVACTQDVLVDPRGYIYLSGTNDGIWIVRETGD